MRTQGDAGIGVWGAALVWLGLAAAGELATARQATRLHDLVAALQQEPRAWEATRCWGLRSRWLHPTPAHRQRRRDGCGAAALGAVLQARGRRVSQELLWGMCRIPSGGTTLARLAATARCLGQPGEARLATRLDALPLPAIVHLRRRHFVVLQRLAAGRAEVLDPACGTVLVPPEKLRAEASGAVLVFRPRRHRDAGGRP
jgi:hypothetical protein